MVSRLYQAPQGQYSPSLNVVGGADAESGLSHSEASEAFFSDAPLDGRTRRSWTAGRARHGALIAGLLAAAAVAVGLVASGVGSRPRPARASLGRVVGAYDGALTSGGLTSAAITFVSLTSNADAGDSVLEVSDTSGLDVGTVLRIESITVDDKEDKCTVRAVLDGTHFECEQGLALSFSAGALVMPLPTTTTPNPAPAPVPTTDSPTAAPTATPTPAPTEATPAPTKATEAPTVAPTPAPTEATPAPTEATPAPTKATPAPTEAAPAPTEATPAPTKATPAPTKATPAPTEATPAPTEATPAPTKATPAPTKATPAPTEATPAPTQATPAPTEATPAPTEAAVEIAVATDAPTIAPTPAPTEATPAPTEATPAPTDAPTPEPTAAPTPEPTAEPTPSPTPAPTEAPVLLAASAKKGDTTVEVTDESMFSEGDAVEFATESFSETHTIIGFGSVQLDSPLEHSYPKGSTITRHEAGGVSPVLITSVLFVGFAITAVLFVIVVVKRRGSAATVASNTKPQQKAAPQQDATGAVSVPSTSLWSPAVSQRVLVLKSGSGEWVAGRVVDVRSVDATTSSGVVPAGTVKVRLDSGGVKYVSDAKVKDVLKEA